MLYIFLGKREGTAYGPLWFKYNYESKWLADPFVGEMIQDVDKSRYMGGELIMSDVLGPIPPERLSGGVKTLISMYERTDVIFDATSCGPNCAKWLLEMGKRKDVSIDLNYFMPFDNMEPFAVYIENANKTVCDMRDYTFTVLHYL